MLLCLLKSLERHGFKRVLIVNGHGGNIAALNAFLPDFARETGLTMRVTTSFELAHQAPCAEILEDQEGVQHACEAETSMMLVVAPDTVKREQLAEAHGPPHLARAGRPAGGARFARFKRRHRQRRDRRRAPRQRARRASGCSPPSPRRWRCHP